MKGTGNPASGRAQSASRSTGIRPAVLIVDDVPANLIALEAMLRRDDVEIIAASSGANALEILLERQVAVAIIDVQMPDMDGFELASLMHSVERTRHIPIVFVTAGSHDRARVARGYQTGAVDYLYKPIDEQVLCSKVDVFVTLERNRQRLEEADRMRELFIAVLGHDLRNPLSGILMGTQLLRMKSERENMDEHLDLIERSGNRMHRMIEQLLDATRFRKDGTVSLLAAAADLHAVAGQIVAEFEQSDNRIKIHVEGDTCGTWDLDRVAQVLSNLIGNAVGHSPADAHVRVHIDGTDSAAVMLHVHNGGPPIPEEIRSVLFEPFRRFELVPRRRQGLGLGLYITQQLVHAHGGTLAFESSHESGTCFTVGLPRHVSATSTSGGKAKNAVAPKVVSPPRASAKATVLLVEDDETARSALSELLKESGYSVLTSGTPLQALNIAQDHPGAIDLLLSDVRLPEMPGDELAQRLNAVRPGVGVVFMSGLPTSPQSEAAFVQKPVDLDALVATLERTLAATRRTHASFRK